MKTQVALRVVSFTDHRTPDLKGRYAQIEQARADEQLLKLFNARVKLREFRRDQVKATPSLLRAQAE